MITYTKDIAEIKYHNWITVLIFFVVLLPFGNLIGKCLPDPLNFNGIGKIAEDIIAERTKANGPSKLHVRVSLSFLLLCQKY